VGVSSFKVWQKHHTALWLVHNTTGVEPERLMPAEHLRTPAAISGVCVAKSVVVFVFIIVCLFIPFRLVITLSVLWVTASYYFFGILKRLVHISPDRQQRYLLTLHFLHHLYMQRNTLLSSLLLF